ncbi:MAG: UDP-N-acetylmuramate dehydrogenase [Parcubacteria group bacterium]
MMEIPNLQRDISLAPYTTYKIGGKADYFIIAKSKDELISAVIKARENKIPYFILGTGANILVGDKGFRGLVIKNEARSISFKENLVTADSGVVLSDLIQETLKRSLSGLEHYAGIPSSIGGAIWQNLHFLSPDRETTLFIESVVESAEILDEENKLLKVGRDFFKFAYDYSILHEKNVLVTEVTFRLVHKDKEKIMNQISENLKWREDRQPQLDQFPSCGSVFKKIEGVGAGRLIDEVGLKGYKIGGAMVSEKHANYLVNTGNATASDVGGLIDLIKKKVERELGYTLETEISFVGEF